MNPFQLRFWIVIGALFVAHCRCGAMVLTPWTPLFKGIDHAIGTNKPSGTYPNLNVIHAIRVDLQDPDIQLFTSPRIANYQVNARETEGHTVSDFLRLNKLQLAINANLFDPQDYYLPAGTPMDIFGLSICRGDVVSPQENSSHSASVMFTSNNVAEIVYTNWPARNNNGTYTAVSGDYCVLVKGVNVGYSYRNSGGIHDTNPRTGLGLSQDRRYLYLITIDGRQPGYSVGAFDFETAAWLQLVGAYDGVDLDGGGSTTLVMQNSTGAAVRLNKPSAVADSGKERTVGSHLGIYAKPVPGFIDQVTVVPDDTSAIIQWVTGAPATGQVQYGTDVTLGSSSAAVTDFTTNHSITISGLTPNTLYYYDIQSATNGGGSVTSPVFSFTTTNYVTTNILVDLTNSNWKFSYSDLDGVKWADPSYDDSGWNGPAPALLWVDWRGVNGNLSQLATQMPFDSSTQYPYSTYYFRTMFDLPAITPGTTLYITDYIDDGAVFYLNGQEIYRLRMPDAPQSISYTDLAIGYACGGDATCPDDLQLPPEAAQALQVGQNVFAAEVHNYNARSPDITFGASLLAEVPRPKATQLSISASEGTIIVSWTGPGILQEADAVSGPWTDVLGSSVSSPWQASAAAQAHFYRLR